MQLISKAIVEGSLQALSAQELQVEEIDHIPAPSHHGNRHQRRAAAAIERREFRQKSKAEQCAR